jgi:hypothetical protein
MKAKAVLYFLILCRQLLSLERYRRKKVSKWRSIAEVNAFYGSGIFMATASEGVTPGIACDSAHCTLHTHQSRAQIFGRQATYQICGTQWKRSVFRILSCLCAIEWDREKKHLSLFSPTRKGFWFMNIREKDKKYFFSPFLFMFVIQHCFICCPSDYTVAKDAGIESRTVATMALKARRSIQSARSHPAKIYEISLHNFVYKSCIAHPLFTYESYRLM